MIHRLGGFNQNQIRGGFRGFNMIQCMILVGGGGGGLRR